MTQRYHNVEMTVRMRRQWIFGIGKHLAGAFLPFSHRIGTWLGLCAFNAMRVEYRLGKGRWRLVPGPYAVQEMIEQETRE